MMAKAMALQVQADRVEQTDTRRTSLRAEADRLGEQARFVNADGTAIPKTAADEWQDAASALDAQIRLLGADALNRPSEALTLGRCKRSRNS